MNRQQSRPAIRKADIPLTARPDSPSLGPESRILTVAEAAGALRCSKAHVHNLINGKVDGMRPLPSLQLGRRRLIRKISLDLWIEANEQCYDPITPGLTPKAHGKD